MRENDSAQRAGGFIDPVFSQLKGVDRAAPGLYTGLVGESHPSQIRRNDKGEGWRPMLPALLFARRKRASIPAPFELLENGVRTRRLGAIIL